MDKLLDNDVFTIVMRDFISNLVLCLKKYAAWCLIVILANVDRFSIFFTNAAF